MTYQPPPPGPYGFPGHTPAPPQKRKRWWLIAGIAAGILVLCCGGLAILGAIVGTPKKTASTSVVASAHPTAAALHASPAAGSPSPTRATPTASAPPRAAAAPDFVAAAAVLLADDEHYRQELAAGPPVLGTPAFTPWWQKASADTTCESDFKKADAYFTADNEPTDLIEAWRADNGQAVEDVYKLAAAELAAGPGPATSDMRAAEVAFQGDIAKADADARKLQAMKH